MGSAHDRDGIPNQDAYSIAYATTAGGPIALCLCDGHSGAAHCRSSIGAEIGSKIALKIRSVLESCEVESWFQDPDSIDEVVSVNIPQMIVSHWNEAVDKHLLENPFVEDEIKSLSAKELRSVMLSPRVAYGSTMNFAAFAHGHVIAGRLGDGEIVFVKDGKAARIFQDDPSVSEETESFCQKNAANAFETHWEPVTEDGPYLILLSTDGLPKACAIPQEFDRFGLRCWEYIQEHGEESLQQKLQKALDERTDPENVDAIGDDATAGVMFLVTSERKVGDESAREASIDN